VLFFLLAIICTFLSIPLTIWAFAAMYRSQVRVKGVIVLIAGVLGIAFVYFFVIAINSGWLPTGNIFLCWLHFLVPSEEPHRFFFAWAPVGFLEFAALAACLTGGYSVLHVLSKKKMVK